MNYGIEFTGGEIPALNPTGGQHRAGTWAAIRDLNPTGGQRRAGTGLAP
jgi:hypothetical protein